MCLALNLCFLIKFNICPYTSILYIFWEMDSGFVPLSTLEVILLKLLPVEIVHTLLGRD